MAEDRSPIEQWDRYWGFGALHSFSQVAQGNYRGAIADFWRQRFGTLGPGARVADIATGNGAVALLALEAADAAGIAIEVHGIDLADIDPARTVGDPAVRRALGRVRFHPRTPAERLPFAAASVDLVCSQFGLEYSELDESVPELGRVCAPGGHVALVVHHADSDPLAATGREIGQLGYVLEESGLWDAARQLLEALREQERAGADATAARVERQRRAVDAALGRIRRQAEAAEDSRMLIGPTRYIHEIFSMVGRSPTERLEQLLEEARRRVAANRDRLVDMKAAALDETGLQALVNGLGRAGFDVSVAQALHEHDGSLLGWQLVAQRQ